MSQAVHAPAALPRAMVGPSAASQAGEEDRARAAERAERVRSIVSECYSFLWRSLRRLGVPEGDVEDAAQQCLWVVAQRIDDIERGKEKAFLFGVAIRVSKAFYRGREDVCDGDESALDRLPSPGLDPGEELDERRARALLDAMLASVPLELRVVFILYELEELTMLEIAQMLDLPPGTVASRLRRARVAFEALSRRVQRRLERGEGHR